METADLAARLQEYFGGEHTVALMESCTGGLLASALTDVPGSGYLLASAVCYHNDAKVALGVPSALIEEHGVVSGEVAEAMATAAARFFGAEYGLATTGVAGPDAEDGIPPGTVWLGVYAPPGRAASRLLHLSGERETVKHDAVREACRLLLESLPCVPIPASNRA